MQEKKTHFKYHIFFCTNKRENGEQACEDYNAQNMRLHAKKICKNLKKVRINQAGCLGRCEHGPVMVVYPQGTWYQYVDKLDIEEIIHSHVENGIEVERLKIDKS